MAASQPQIKWRHSMCVEKSEFSSKEIEKGIQDIKELTRPLIESVQEIYKDWKPTIEKLLKADESTQIQKSPESEARQLLSNFSLFSSTDDVRKAAEALSKVHEKDPSLSKSILAEAKNSDRYFGKSLLAASETMLFHVVELAGQESDLSPGWKKYDMLLASENKVLEQALNTDESRKLGAELIASMLIDGTKAGKESVSRLRRSIHLPEYQGNLEKTIQDGKTLSEIMKSNGIKLKDRDLAWRRLKELDSYLKAADTAAADPKSSDAEAIDKAANLFKKAIEISPAAFEQRAAVYAHNTRQDLALQKARSKRNA